MKAWFIACRRIAGQSRLIIPAVVFTLGVLSIALLFSTDALNEEQRVNFILLNALMDVQTKAATSHLWLEEAVSGDETTGEALSDIDEAIALADVVLNGGKSEHGFVPGPLKDPELRGRAEAIKSLLVKFKLFSLERLRNPGEAGIASAADQQFDAAFKEILGKVGQLEEIIERNNAKSRAESGRLFLGMLSAWTFIVIVTAAGLWNREARRKRAEEALLKANEQLYSQAEELRVHREHLEEAVDARTAEVTAVNERLRREIVERAETEVALKESEKQLRRLSGRLMTAQETERRRIAREMHDALGHTLTIAKLRLRSLEKSLHDEKVREDCEDIACCVDDVIDDVRQLSREISPTIIQDLGLTSALQWLVDNFNKSFEGSVACEIANIDDLFPEDAQIVVYRVLQEAITNIAKHASAGEAAVVARRTEGKVSFSIEDNGKGFNPSSFMRDPAGKGLGLAIMEERVRMLGGILEISGQEGKGTHIAFTIPDQRIG